jgi:hypothetical protein
VKDIEYGEAASCSSRLRQGGFQTPSILLAFKSLMSEPKPSLLAELTRVLPRIGISACKSA